MNKRQKKKLEKKKALWGVTITPIKSQWNTNTPIWKRCKKSGRKRTVRYRLYIPSYTRNFRRYSPELIAEAMRRFENVIGVSDIIESAAKELPYAFEIVNDNIGNEKHQDHAEVKHE